MNIEKNLWHVCHICKKDIKEIAKKYGGSNIYYTKCFEQHLEKEHNITIDQYFDKILSIPKCPCGICNKKLGIKRNGSNFNFKKYSCGRNSGVMTWSEKAKETRKGKNNPMYQKIPWNYGLTKESSSSVRIVSEKMSNRNISEKTKHNMSISAKNRTIHGHSGKRHSEESKEKMRKATLERIANGDFKQTKTLPHRTFAKLLDRLQIEYTEEHVIDCWSFDFLLLDSQILVEVDGDYFHSNPKIYPNGPISKTQKINKYRDDKKNKFCKTNNLKLIRFWECDILNNEKEIECAILKLLA